MTTVHEINPLLDPRWPLLVEKHSRASVYHTKNWLEALRRTYGYEPVVFTTSSADSELRNAIVFCRVQSWLTGRRMVSLPFSDFCEPLVDSVEEWELLASQLRASQKREKWKYLELRPIRFTFPTTGAGTEFKATEEFYHHRIDLQPSVDELLKSFAKDTVQRRIRRAVKAGVIEECGRSEELLKQFYDMMVMTRSRQQLPPQPYSWFLNLIDCLGDALEIRVASSDGIPVAAILTLRHGKVVTYKYGCSDKRYSNLGATPLLFWNAIVSAKSGGASEFDLGRSQMENQGLVTFKNHWVSPPTSLVYWRCPGPKSPSSSDDWKMKLMKRVFSNMPDGLLIATGKVFYRHIG